VDFFRKNMAGYSNRPMDALRRTPGVVGCVFSARVRLVFFYGEKYVGELETLGKH
jgi:hypothetical protein